MWPSQPHISPIRESRPDLSTSQQPDHRNKPRNRSPRADTPKTTRQSRRPHPPLDQYHPVMPKTSTGKSQLAKLAIAHKPSPRPQTARTEDYIEIISELIHGKGYAKPVDIASHLHVTRPTVTGMLDKLREEQLIVHDYYRGVILTERGSSMAEALRRRHGLLVNFLKLLG